MEAIILAGGMGTRLKSVVSDVPKPMALINGKPFLCYMLDELIGNNFTDVILSVGYKKETIIDYFGEKYKEINLKYSEETEPLGTGGAIKQALNMVTQTNVFVLNGDTFFVIDYKRLFRQHVNNRAQLTISLKEMHHFDRYGTVVTSKNKVIDFQEKRFLAKGNINGGIYVLCKDLFNSIVMPQKFSFEVDFLEKYYNKLVFETFMSNGYFIDIGVPEDYLRAQKELKSHFEA
jgi:NDP-sugar pyrophosphorylase family protein